jgi:hypothetical protein
MNAVIAVFNSLSLRGRSRYTADFSTYRSLGAHRLSERTVLRELFWFIIFPKIFISDQVAFV